MDKSRVGGDKGGDEPPPEYSSHQYDEVFTDEQRLETASSVPPSTLPQPQEPSVTQQPTIPSAAELPAYAPPPGPLTLILAKNSIFVSSQPNEILYSMPRPLTWSGSEISIERVVPAHQQQSGRSVKARNWKLYSMVRVPFSAECELRPQRGDCYGSGVAVLTKRHGLRGSVWEVAMGGQVVVRNVRGKWKGEGWGGEDGVVAVEASEVGAPNILVVQDGVDAAVRDLVVCAWCARIWVGRTH